MTDSSYHRDRRLRVVANIHTRALGEELVLLDFARGEYFSLDEVAGTLWRMLEAGTSIPEMAELLVKRYDVSDTTALRDVTKLVADLIDRSLVVAD